MIENFSADSSWFVHDRFGLFIHWGIYALAARGEWAKQVERINDETYQRYFDHFSPDLYDPTLWAQEAYNAGMQYFVVTTKHHDGFCLWDSALTDYKATKTPWGKDVLHPLVDAFRAKDMKVGFYHSLLDWHHPEFTADGIHPMREDLAFRRRAKHRDMQKYTEYLHGQTRELLTQFGKLHIMWFDFSYSHMDFGWSKGKGKEDWQSEKLAAMVRELQPGILMNDRLDVGGDIKTPEQYMPQGWMEINGQRVLWEACQTMNDSWGYNARDMNWKPVDLLIQNLIDAVSKGGNLLLNVGPNARGEFDPRSIERLRGIGAWMRLHNRSIYGCTASDFTPPPDTRYTQNGNRLYLHLFAWPYRFVHLPGLADRVEYAQFLHDGAEVKQMIIDPDQEAQNLTMTGTRGALTLELPILKPDVTIPVIELFLK